MAAAISPNNNHFTDVNGLDGVRTVIAGTTTSPNFPLANPINTIPPGNTLSFSFVMRVDFPAPRDIPGNFLLGSASLIYSTVLGHGGTISTANDVVFDNAACAVVCGESNDPSFPLANALSQKGGGTANSDAFVTRLSTAGNSVVFSTFMGIDSTGQGQGVRVSGTGDIVLAGAALGNLGLVTPGAFQSSKPGGNDAFLARIYSCLTLRDHDGNGTSDLLFLNDANGGVFFWEFDREVFQRVSNVGTVDTSSFDLQGFGDLDGNGSPDLIWRNRSHGDVFFWLYDRERFFRDRNPFTFDPGYTIEGVADFNGDGTADLVVRNRTNGDTFIDLLIPGQLQIGATAHLGIISPGFRIVTTGDFDGDGIPDLLLANTVSGDHFFWFMNQPSGSTITVKSTRFFLTLPTSYQFRGSGDFNVDGQTDLVLRNLIDGSVYFYIMGRDSQGAPAVLRADFLGLADPGYSIRNR